MKRPVPPGRRLALLLAALLALGVPGATFALRQLYARYEGGGAIIPDDCRTMRFEGDAGELQGYYFPGERGLVLLIPGFRALALDYLPVIRALGERGWAVFSFDATGTGRSGGDSQRGFPQILEDARAARRFLAGRGDLGHGTVLLMGHSRGGYGAAALLEESDGAALVSAADCAMEAQTRALSGILTWPLSATWPALWLIQRIQFGADVDFHASDALAGSQTPTLVIQGEDDEIAPPDHHSLWSHRAVFADRAKLMYVATPAEDGHTDLLYTGETANAPLINAICDFFEACADRRGK